MIAMRILIFFLWVSYSVLAQQKFSKEFSFTNDNDFFVSTFHDKYYTNGMFFTYRHLTSRENKQLEKEIYQWQLGHLMFTPFKSTIESFSQHDRPFAAYLYVGFEQNKIYKAHKIVKWEVQLGVIGPAALGQNLQNFIHDIYGFQRPVGWKYQIKNALGINLGGSYLKRLMVNESNLMDFSFISNLRLGTVFTDLSTGFMGRIGFNRLQDLSNSIAFNTHLNNNSTSGTRALESMLYYKGILTYALYDATIEGSFLNTSSPITYDINPFRFDLELGLLFTINRMHLGYAYHFYSDKLKNLRFPNGNSYGTIKIGYLFN